jgi:hypothetical protein
MLLYMPMRGFVGGVAMGVPVAMVAVPAMVPRAVPAMAFFMAGFFVAALLASLRRFFVCRFRSCGCQVCLAGFVRSRLCCRLRGLFGGSAVLFGFACHG